MRKEIQHAFNQSAAQYDRVAKVQFEIGLQLLARLDYIKITPDTILDLGCGSGKLIQLLQKRYPKAQIIGVDYAFNMLLESQKKQSIFKKWRLCQADMHMLPFANDLFDLIIANQTIHWTDSISKVFVEIHRIMAPNACLMFSTLGPDTFSELRNAWLTADSYLHTNPFYDLHHIGDHLLANQFVDPVVDVDYITLHYSTCQNLLHSLKAQGVRNINPKRNTGLTGKQALRKFYSAYESFRSDNGKYPLTYEVVYGHAWKGKARQQAIGTETFIPIERLRHKKQPPP